MAKTKSVAVKGKATVAPVTDNSIINIIERMATDPSCDIDKMERLLAMQERILAKESEEMFSAALSKAQSEMGRVRADADNPQTRSKYASYAALDRAVRPIYTSHGFGLSFDTGECPHENWVRVVCYVSNSGFSRTYHIDMPADGKGAKGGDVMTKTHATGSAITYGKRYLLGMIFNIAVGNDPDDDDGNAAGDSAEKISAEQKAALIEKMQNSGVDLTKLTERFLRRMSIPFLDDLPASKYDAAMEMLNSIKPKKEKADA